MEIHSQSRLKRRTIARLVFRIGSLCKGKGLATTNDACGIEIRSRVAPLGLNRWVAQTLKTDRLRHPGG